MKTTHKITLLTAVLILITGIACDSDSDDQIAEQNNGQSEEVLQCSVEPGQCTRDINECGNASHCTCPDGYSYNGAIAECLYDFGVTDDEDISNNTFESADENLNLQCVLPAGDICTRDINECGNPSSCSCPDGYAYSPAINKCLYILR